MEKYLISLNLNAEQLLDLVKINSHPTELLFAAQCDNCPEKAFKILMKDESIFAVNIRIAIALNKNTSANILTELYATSTATVQEAIMMNNNTPVEVLIEGAENSDKTVRDLAENMLIKRLSKDNT
jgi:hypothetical protein